MKDQISNKKISEIYKAVGVDMEVVDEKICNICLRPFQTENKDMDYCPECWEKQ